MNFAARRNTLEAQRRMLARHLPEIGTGAGAALAGAIPLGWQPKGDEQRCGEMLGHMEMDELRRIDVALARLREGSYGFCQICGDDIEEERLDKCPATPFCSSCDG
ncbi:TraR/DksA family transcriptional regulator [Parasedimentitalea huanghaiensis]|uniref:TraR/DksA family transcriptional regulator n=1 Tax=Parasedimentitalea huanghaiensis TaxID=2682100 RepID=A0A6L6WK27_9RHOB|nr:TraR/DksA C4-type zinc finger protein [Zongyanglinia huanghaiensis]MVO16092.1 TraR/DksA family transcriptional regulator [Zongyanglinia huanghaiensis]